MYAHYEFVSGTVHMHITHTFVKKLLGDMVKRTKGRGSRFDDLASILSVKSALCTLRNPTTNLSGNGNDRMV